VECVVLPAALAVKLGEHGCAGSAGQESGPGTNPRWRMLDEPQWGVPAGEAGACSSVRNRAAFGGERRSALKLSRTLGRPSRPWGSPCCRGRRNERNVPCGLGHMLPKARARERSLGQQ